MFEQEQLRQNRLLASFINNHQNLQYHHQQQQQHQDESSIININYNHHDSSGSSSNNSSSGSGSSSSNSPIYNNLNTEKVLNYSQLFPFKQLQQSNNNNNNDSIFPSNLYNLNSITSNMNILSEQQQQSITNSILSLQTNNQNSNNNNLNHLNQLQQQLLIEEQQESNVIDPSEDTTNPNFHPIACKNCRKVHKRCDKKLPSCSNCIRKGLSCEYATPKKKGRKNVEKKEKKKSSKQSKTSTSSDDLNEIGELGNNSSSTNTVTTTSNEGNNNVISSTSLVTTSSSLATHRYQPYPLVSSSLGSNSIRPSASTSSLNSTQLKPITNSDEIGEISFIKQNFELTLVSLRKQTIDMYRLVAYPMLPRSTFEYLLTIANLDENDNVSFDAKALLYSVHANIEQRLGTSHIITEQLVESTKKLLSLAQSDWSNTNVIAAHFFLSICLIGLGKHKDALYYLNNMNFAIEDIKNKENLQQEEKMLVKMNELANLEVNNAIDFDCNRTSTQTQSPILELALKRYPVVFKLLTDQILPQNVLPLSSFTKENIPSIFKTIETIGSIVMVYLKINCNCDVLMKAAELMGLLHRSMLKLLTVVTIDNTEWEMIIDFCKIIGDGIDNEYCKLLPSHAILPVAVSSREVMRLLHLQSVGVAIRNPTNVDFYDLLAKHLRAVHMLKSKYKRVEVYYDDLIKEMEVVYATKTFTSYNGSSYAPKQLLLSNFLFGSEFSLNTNTSSITSNDEFLNNTELDFLLEEFK